MRRDTFCFTFLQLIKKDEENLLELTEQLLKDMEYHLGMDEEETKP